MESSMKFIKSYSLTQLFNKIIFNNKYEMISEKYWIRLYIWNYFYTKKQKLRKFQERITKKIEKDI